MAIQISHAVIPRHILIIDPTFCIVFSTAMADHVFFLLRWMCIGSFVLMGMSGWTAGRSSAQSLDSIRTEAQKAYHGPDREGKDGPLAKVGLDLALLYYEYQAHVDGGGAPEAFRPRTVKAPVDSGFVTIDATAEETAGALREDLEALGLQRAAAAKRMVSGRLPIERIPDAAALPTLRSARPARAMTQSQPPAPAPQPDPADSEPSEDEPMTEAEDDRMMLWFLGAAVAIVIIAGGTVVLLNRQRQ